MSNTMSSHEIGRISLAIEVNGEPYFVVLPHDKLRLLLNLAKSLSESGTLHVTKAPEGYRFETLEKGAKSE